MQTPPAKATNTPEKPSTPSRFWVTTFFIAICLGIPLFIFYFLVTGSLNNVKKTAGLAGMKSAAASILMYSLDHNGYFPPADSWMDAAQPFANSEGAFHSPVVSNGNKDIYGIAFRTDLGSKQMSPELSGEPWAMVFDSTLMQRNAHSGLETLPTPGRYRTKEGPSNIVAFIDGSAQAIPDNARRASTPDSKPRIR